MLKLNQELLEVGLFFINLILNFILNFTNFFSFQENNQTLVNQVTALEKENINLKNELNDKSK